MALFVSMFHAALAVIGGLIFFGIGRVVLPVLYGVPFLSIFLRPFTAHFLKGSWTIVLFFYHIRLVVRACFLSFSTFLVWETTDNLFDRVITEARLFVSHQNYYIHNFTENSTFRSYIGSEHNTCLRCNVF